MRCTYLFQVPDSFFLKGVEFEGEIMCQAGLQCRPLCRQIGDVALKKAIQSAKSAKSAEQ